MIIIYSIILLIIFNKTISLFEEKLKEYENNEDVQRALFFAFKSYKNK